MNTNDLNRRLRYALSLDDKSVQELLGLGNYAADITQISAWRKQPEDDNFEECPGQAIDALLEGLIVKNRGPSPTAAVTAAESEGASLANREAESRRFPEIDNNTLLKQLKIALSLRTDEVQQLIHEGGGKLGKSEVNALFRRPSARNFRRCGDQVLRWFLAGLAARRAT
ncbi:MAG: DUF1456 family protein [Granulosicoccus sp.]